MAATSRRRGCWSTGSGAWSGLPPRTAARAGSSTSPGCRSTGRYRSPSPGPLTRRPAPAGPARRWRRRTRPTRRCARSGTCWHDCPLRRDAPRSCERPTWTNTRCSAAITKASTVSSARSRACCEPPTGWELGLILDEIERTGDVPRYPRGPQHARWFIHRHGTVPQLMSRIHLMWEEAAAFLVLLIGLTGHNGGTLGDMPAVHHRPDGQAGGTASAIVELRKPRRGKHRSHLPTALVDLSDPGATVAGEPPGEVPARHELHSPFGIYRLLLELTEPARRLVGTDRLLVCWAPKGFSCGPGFRVGATPSMVPVWGRRRHLPADPNPQQPDTPPGLLSVTMARLRLSYLQHHQKAVAHTDRVLATEYLGRDRGNLVDYQRVVARVLDEQVARAKASALVATLSAADLAEARRDPAAVAARFGITPAALRRLLDGELDTVLAACVDHTNSPHAPAGEPCRASFLRCLDCPCARATPAHLPVQTLVLDALEARRTALAPLAWAQRFALPHAQLTEVLSRFSPAVVDVARATVTAADRRLVERLLSRELDWGD